ncbi:uncharacterized protein J8A68_001519 [[Candida] subhashii]|uniref:Uncharacterized protein n=1 Tax=[Candida] subhashii TaxID=561895 RepID=A0A8J5QN09_9ASCO|nr:uncharacterized protein J8A68_001519 [[Candida] subhashii]KAG7664933.1 hypothetical protein J8A68_001519 [[Candida] subhashii]
MAVNIAHPPSYNSTINFINPIVIPSNNNNNNKNSSGHSKKPIHLHNLKQCIKPVLTRTTSKKQLNVKKSFNIHSIKSGKHNQTSHPLNLNQIEDQDSDIDDDDNIDEYTFDSCSDDLSFVSQSSNSSLNSPNEILSAYERKQPCNTSNDIFSYHSFNNDHYSYMSPRSSSVISIPSNRSSSLSTLSSTSTLDSLSTLPTLATTRQSSVCCVIPSSPSCSPVTNEQLPTCISAPLSKSTSTDCLQQILKKSSPSKNKPSLYSNLTSSIKNWKTKFSHNKDNFVRIFMESPRLTDDKLPVTLMPREIHHKHDYPSPNDANILPSQELVTFNDNSIDPNVPTWLEPHCKPTFKNRDQRINSEFLRMYAHDYNARVKTNTLPANPTQEELVRLIHSTPSLRQFHYQYNMYRVSNMSRDKLWTNVILPPRSDETPSLGIDGSCYIYASSDTSDEDSGDDKSKQDSNIPEKESYSLIRRSGKYLPWDSNMTKSSIRPAGILPHGKCEFNGEAPNSGVTRTQFTVKGWCNPRWVDSS